MNAENHDRSLLKTGDYFACEKPEKAPNGWHTWYKRTCRACIVSMGAAAMENPHWSVVNETDHTSADAASRYEEYRGEHGLPPLPERENARAVAGYGL